MVDEWPDGHCLSRASCCLCRAPGSGHIVEATGFSFPTQPHSLLRLWLEPPDAHHLWAPGAVRAEAQRGLACCCEFAPEAPGLRWGMWATPTPGTVPQNLRAGMGSRRFWTSCSGESTQQCSEMNCQRRGQPHARIPRSQPWKSTWLRFHFSEVLIWLKLRYGDRKAATGEG